MKSDYQALTREEAEKLSPFQRLYFAKSELQKILSTDTKADLGKFSYTYLCIQNFISETNRILIKNWIVLEMKTSCDGSLNFVEAYLIDLTINPKTMKDHFKSSSFSLPPALQNWSDKEGKDKFGVLSKKRVYEDNHYQDSIAGLTQFKRNLGYLILGIHPSVDKDLDGRSSFRR